MCGIFTQQSKMKWFRTWLTVISTYNAVGGFLALCYPRTLDHLFPRATEIAGNSDMFFRSMGWWALTTALIRSATVIYPMNTTLYNITYGTFILWELFFLSEVYIYGTCGLHNVAFGLTAGSISLIWMTIIGWNKTKKLI